MKLLLYSTILIAFLSSCKKTVIEEFEENIRITLKVDCYKFDQGDRVPAAGERLYVSWTTNTDQPNSIDKPTPVTLTTEEDWETVPEDGMLVYNVSDHVSEQGWILVWLGQADDKLLSSKVWYWEDIINSTFIRFNPADGYAGFYNSQWKREMHFN